MTNQTAQPVALYISFSPVVVQCASGPMRRQAMRMPYAVGSRLTSQ